MPPMLDPLKQSTETPAASRTPSTPMWAKPPRRPRAEGDSYRAPRDPARDRIEDWRRSRAPLHRNGGRCDFRVLETIRPHFVSTCRPSCGVTHPNCGDVNFPVAWQVNV